MKKTILNLRFVPLAWLAASSPSLQAQITNIWDFNYTGSIVAWTVPSTGIYDITAYGAQGGQGESDLIRPLGGLGAQIGGSFQLIGGQTLNILVGGGGFSTNGGTHLVTRVIHNGDVNVA